MFQKKIRHAVVRAGGFEPPRFPSLEPKSSASANSATPAAAVAGAAVPTRRRKLLITKARRDIGEPLPGASSHPHELPQSVGQPPG
jgi:hypothetical protein